MFHIQYELVYPKNFVGNKVLHFDKKVEKNYTKL